MSKHSVNRYSSRRRATYRSPKMDTAGIAQAFLLLLSSSHLLRPATAKVFPTNHKLYKFDYLGPLGIGAYNDEQQIRGLKPRYTLSKRDNPIPLIVTNNCPDVIWPGVATQAGDAPDSHGFELQPGETMNLTVGPTWAGRVWGRTNCTVSGSAATCETGDCQGKLDCQYGGSPPQTLAEFNLAGYGSNTFYDISLVDGYNLPLSIVYHPSSNLTYIPPNLVNPSCIGTTGYLSAPASTGTTYTNSTYPVPYEPSLTNQDIENWCPWDLQLTPPYKPGDGIYPYPDDNIQRPVFDPCLSACASTHSARDCCTGSHDSSDSCKPSLYSKYAKTVCPDAYSYAYDDADSTFAVPMGGGWEVVFCPVGRSTNILATFKGAGLSTGGISTNGTSEGLFADSRNVSFIEANDNAAAEMMVGSSWWIWKLVALWGGFLVLG
ncbi:thaumatin family protein [Xylariaceae sp. FL0255]|nr:thaumatin family protein [Xylariaceae sp. FL0255]